MLQVARLAARALRESAELVGGFVRGRRLADGSFMNRAGDGDLYYTIFGIECLAALKMEIEAGRLAGYLKQFGHGAELDLVHMACLARGWAYAGLEGLGEAGRTALAGKIERHRSLDGGYDADEGEKEGTIYGCFLATGAYQDLGLEVPQGLRMAGCIEGLRTRDGGYANQRNLPIGTVPSTAAAVTLLRQLGREIPRGAGDWLASCCHEGGGFFATPGAPAPDLLSTATALHALAGMGLDFGKLKETCLDFVDSLWVSGEAGGSFCGSWLDEALDVEYTYYGLLALGHLSV